jgi:hypothetical protein
MPPDISPPAPRFYLLHERKQLHSLRCFNSLRHCRSTWCLIANPRSQVMLTVSEPNLLLRLPGKVPKGLKLRTEEFQRDWDLAPSMDTCRLQKEIHPRRWYLIKTAAGSMSSRVGGTSQQAIAGALTHVLRGIGDQSNVVDVKLIELIQYQWIFLARVEVVPYRIQRNSKSPASADAVLLPVAPSRKFAARVTAQDSYSVNIVPMLKEMLVSARSTVRKGIITILEIMLVVGIIQCALCSP